MPPARRKLEALGSLPLLSYANNPAKVITELAFIADERLNTGDGDQDAADAPLEIQFDEFMDGVNSRGKGTKTRQRKTTAEQAAAVLLVAVQQRHIELIVKKEAPDTIETIVILPEATKKLATFLPKLRGYGDIPYDQQYRGAIALAKRHFFSSGRAPTRKELMSMLLQCQQEKRDLRAPRPLTRMLSVQTSWADITNTPGIGMTNDETKNSLAIQSPSFASLREMDGPSASASQSDIETRSTDTAVNTEPELVTPDANLDNDGGGDMVPELMELAPIVPNTPVAKRAVHSYMTPVSNPRPTGRVAAVPLQFESPPTIVTNPSTGEPFGSSRSSSWKSQQEAMFKGVLDTVFAKFAAVCQRASDLEAQKLEIQVELDGTRGGVTSE
ncbi:hypothetical protein BU15DRAFT_61350 [Melanogaster broomeanus]|nr:hypothetical protein BU15DRAFT_61350 [Melanogaster broomeanus]